MRAVQVSREVRGPATALVAASTVVSLRHCGLALAPALAVGLVGGDWAVAGVAFAAGALTCLGERLLRRAQAATPTAAPGMPAAAPASAPTPPVVVPTFDRACEQSRTVIDAIGEGVLVVDVHGRIVLANPAVRGALRRPAVDPAGESLREALAPEVAALAHDAWRAVLERSDASTTELPRVRYSGVACRDRFYDIAAVEAVSSRTQHHYGVLLVFVDSTRGFELQRLKDRFLSSVSHELRTPLTNICAYAEILRTLLPGESAEWPEFVRVIHEEGLQISRLVDAMFDFLQLESGEAVFANEAIDGGDVVREVVRSFAIVAVARRIDLQCVEGPDVPALQGDPVRLRQVVRSLVDNALKFTPLGGQVRVTVAARDDGWELRVEDSGPGVPAEDRSAVFDKFHQLRDHLTDKPSGTGLGLATARAVVARFGGLIWCEDSALGGACFVALLPGSGQPRLAVLAGGTGAGGGF